MRAAIRSEAAAGAAIADTLQARAAMVQAFNNIKPAPVRQVRRAVRASWPATVAAACVACLVLTLAGCGGGDVDAEDPGTAAAPARPASAATI
jgi:hypothetical protein